MICALRKYFLGILSYNIRSIFGVIFTQQEAYNVALYFDLWPYDSKIDYGDWCRGAVYAHVQHIGNIETNDTECTFDDVVNEDKVVIVNKHSKPHNVIISYERYVRLLNEDADI